MMKLLLIVLSLLCCLSCNDNLDSNKESFSIPKKEPGVLLTAHLLASYSNYSNPNDKNYYYLVELKLINNTNSEYEFYTLTCGSLVNVITDSKQLSFLYHNCLSNYGILVKLQPKQEYVIPLIILRNRYMQDFHHNIRIGFISNGRQSTLLGKKISLTNQEIISELQNMREKEENVIWSDPVVLTTTNFSQYEIRDILNDSTYSITKK